MTFPRAFVLAETSDTVTSLLSRAIGSAPWTTADADRCRQELSRIAERSDDDAITEACGQALDCVIAMGTDAGPGAHRAALVARLRHLAEVIDAERLVVRRELADDRPG